MDALVPWKISSEWASIPQQLTWLLPNQLRPDLPEMADPKLWSWEGTELSKPWLFPFKNFIDVYYILHLHL